MNNRDCFHGLLFAFLLKHIIQKQTLVYTYVSLREMGDYKTTRLLVCCALDRIWSSTQRLEDLDWFGLEMPYIQYGGGVVFSLYCSRARVLKV